jgi:hypothetical protein
VITGQAADKFDRPGKLEPGNAARGPSHERKSVEYLGRRDPRLPPADVITNPKEIDLTWGVAVIFGKSVAVRN